MAFVTAEDFKAVPPYNLVLDKVPTTFEKFVEQEEEKYLPQVLGSSLYQSFIDGLAALPAAWNPSAATVINTQYTYKNGIWKALTAQTGTAPVEGADWELVEETNRWLALKNGNTYMYKQKMYRWVGFNKAEKPLIYANWCEGKSSEPSSIGFVVPKAENNSIVTPIDRICRAWNEWSRFIGGKCDQRNTLYGYLYNTNLLGGTFDDTFDETFQDFEDYLNHEFIEQPTKNKFGI